MSDEEIVDNNGVSFHGEVCIIRADLEGVTELPQGAKEVKADEQKRLLVAHSESGHHHYVNAAEAKFYGTDDPLVCYLQVAGQEAYLRHAKPASAPDRHKTQRLLKNKAKGNGLFIVKKAREETPEGWRQVQD